MEILKKFRIHLAVIAAITVITSIYFMPAFSGKVLQQDDIQIGVGKSKEIVDYRAENHKEPLWTNSMFGGMPAYQITGIPGTTFTIGILDQLFTLNLPEPIGLFFLASICFYFLAQVLGFSTVIGIIGGLAYSYATYNPIIVVVGHITKMHAIAYLPFFIGSILLIFQKKYYLGAICTAIATTLFVQSNHLQINYYGLIIVLVMSVFYLVKWIQAKDFIHIYKTIGFSLVAGLMGLAVNAVMLIGTVVGWGFVTNTFASWLSWQGYFLGLIGGKDGEWAYSNIGVIFALLIGFFGHIILAKKTIAKQESV